MRLSTAETLLAIVGARAQLDYLLTNYGTGFHSRGRHLSVLEQALGRRMVPEAGAARTSTTLHNSEGWYVARVIVELYRYDRNRGVPNAALSSSH